MRMLAVVLLLSSANANATGRFAVAGGDAGVACVSTARTLPKLPVRITLALPDTGAARTAIVTSRLPQACHALAGGDLPGPFYALHVDHAVADDGWFGVADFGGTPRASIRQCTSMEGVHLTAWSGRPLHGRRLWHAYVYLGYDVDPTCSESETQDVPPR
ncbi:MAG: hypothetical protein HOQ02_08010 [Lysobacter sp.]|nr:hypothetical protein [Lysobacter sp.]